MTKFIEQRVEVLENEVTELKLIIHELRGKKSIEPSTTNTVEDIIEFEGKQYRKVDREAREGDVVIFRYAFTSTLANKPYKAVLVDNAICYKNESDSYRYTCEGWGGKEQYDTYELIKEGLNPQIPMLDETIEPLTPNQQRAEIIEKAKKFVDEHKSKYRTEWNIVGHTVQILIYDSNGMLMMFRQANCNPNDVFNEHIGKAISLGRALGLDVSEFEQAVQPNEVVMGMDLEVRTNGEVDFTHKPIDKDDLFQCNHDFQKDESGVFIINDTNAIYGG